MFKDGLKLGVGGYTNSDFISDIDGRMSISWGVILYRYLGRILNNRSMEAEYTVDV